MILTVFLLFFLSTLNKEIIVISGKCGKEGEKLQLF